MSVLPERLFGLRRRWVLLLVVVLVLALIGSFRHDVGSGPKASASVTSPSTVAASASSTGYRYVAADGVVVDCAAVVAHSAGLPDHAQVWSASSGPVFSLGVGAGTYRVWWVDAVGHGTAMPGVVHGAQRLLPPAGAVWGVAVPGLLVPENSALTWQEGPSCRPGS